MKHRHEVVRRVVGDQRHDRASGGCIALELMADVGTDARERLSAAKSLLPADFAAGVD